MYMISQRCTRRTCAKSSALSHIRLPHDRHRRDRRVPLALALAITITIALPGRVLALLDRLEGYEYVVAVKLEFADTCLDVVESSGDERSAGTAISDQREAGNRGWI
jgi:hypothetical protein